MIVGTPVESYPQERRVALVPAVVPVLTKIGMKVLVEHGAGEKAGFSDAAYEEQGAGIAVDRAQLFSEADIVVRMHGLAGNSPARNADLRFLRLNQIVLGLLDPLANPESIRELAETGVTAFALELLPRVSRAQSMDALSSMATVAGYKAVLLAANLLDKMFPMMITAAGTITPARVFVIGAGVAGLQAIATAHRLGAVVHAYDVRPAVKEQVESLGAKFVESGLETKEAEAAGGYAKAMDENFYRRQREMMTRVLAESDVIITTAAVPGKRAPILITQEMVKGIRSGSVIVDLAAETGGNCELTRPGETVEVNGVSVMGPVNLPSTVPHHASQMYARNIAAFLQLLAKDGELHLNLEDQIIRRTLLTHNKEVVSPLVRELLGFPSAAG
ncbi:MAG: Re/Si-specific NAD(P)(+) transhydrogenase subunit alpha [Deltaproteobacteria bacterium]|nr:Re/Si-specific NAD(P)(+) transhydrogenase subunit alpha [Deltaproteobacteria bacterium]MBI2228435.1 Re/Si-specific NAD(P)(+) transhydrogenase subunit alpha [Deltaproteobacteria bacterium]MBI2365528.1 Re/Si-specific NAD(P)(+) transhydrogenase subunit alpha [Deltaproteobacteria bacterium]MBI3065749.1 Re/Si-specific NAD(P)(+) transhydrogenase subunit alpha [Deltaproteobacteria bacterium]